MLDQPYPLTRVQATSNMAFLWASHCAAGRGAPGSSSSAVRAGRLAAVLTMVRNPSSSPTPRYLLPLYTCEICACKE